MPRDKTRDDKTQHAQTAARALPERPDLAQLKKQARELCEGARAAAPDALLRVRRHHPQASAKPTPPLDAAALRLSAAQFVIAREYGFASWSKLKRHVERAAGAGGGSGARTVTEDLPLIALRDAVVFPGGSVVLDVGRARSLAGLRAAESAKQSVFCVLQRDAATDAPSRADLHDVGTIAQVMWTRARQSGVRVQVRGLASARLVRSSAVEDHERATVERLPERRLTDPELLSSILRLHRQLERVARATERLSIPQLEEMSDAQDLGGLIGLAVAQAAPSARQRWLELSDPGTLVGELCVALEPLAAQPVREPEAPAESSADQDEPRALLLVLYCRAHPHVCGRSFPLRAECTKIGRALDNDVVLQSDAVSRHHAQIERQGEVFVLNDGASTNGSFAGEKGNAVQQHALRDGERFAVGDTLLCLLCAPDLERKRREVIADLAEHDALTQLLGRTAFYSRLDQAVLHARSDETPLSLLLVGVDRLREHNQALGHLGGDQLLRCVARELRERLGSDAIAGRYAGDVFAVAFARTTAAEARVLGDRLREALTAAEPAGPGVRVTFSAGVATLYRTTGTSELIDAALTELGRAQAGASSGQHGPVAA